MQIQPGTISGAWVITPARHADERGELHEWYRADLLDDVVGRALDLRQANSARSVRGTLRGVHVTDVPPGQAKYVTCPVGSVLDVVVDLRVGSPTFGRHELVPLDDVEHRALLLEEGLGHGYLALTDGAVVSYLCSTTYAPQLDRAVHPLCPELAIAWPATGPDGAELHPLLSTKDAAAPTLSQALAAGILPSLDDVRSLPGAGRQSP